MTATGMVNRRQVSAIVAALGVVPPAARLSQSSTRWAPPDSAATADSTSPTQISTVTCRLMAPLVNAHRYGIPLKRPGSATRDTHCNVDAQRQAPPCQPGRLPDAIEPSEAAARKCETPSLLIADLALDSLTAAASRPTAGRSLVVFDARRPEMHSILAPDRLTSSRVDRAKWIKAHLICWSFPEEPQP